jgi:Flp pilus assembly pilin Flp
MAAMTKARHWRDERGAELIEMAIALPLLLLVIMGVVDFGLLLQRYLVLTNAAMEGARVATMPGYSLADAQNRAVTYALASGIPGVDTTATTVLFPLANGGQWPGVEIVLRHTYQYEFIGPIAGLFGGSNFTSVTLTARSTVRRQLGS